MPNAKQIVTEWLKGEIVYGGTEPTSSGYSNKGVSAILERPDTKRLIELVDANLAAAKLRGAKRVASKVPLNSIPDDEELRFLPGP